MERFISRPEDPSTIKCKVGQIVNAIVRDMPEEATGMQQYRIKGVMTGGERVVPEIELIAYEPPANAAPGRR